MAVSSAALLVNVHPDHASAKVCYTLAMCMQYANKNCAACTCRTCESVVRANIGQHWQQACAAAASQLDATSCKMMYSDTPYLHGTYVRARYYVYVFDHFQH